MQITKTKPGPENISIKEKAYFDELKNQKYRMYSKKIRPLKASQSYIKSFNDNDYSCDLSELAIDPQIFTSLRFISNTSKTSFRHYDGEIKKSKVIIEEV